MHGERQLRFEFEKMERAAALQARPNGPPRVEWNSDGAWDLHRTLKHPDKARDRLLKLLNATDNNKVLAQADFEELQERRPLP
jgi:hypothetical protein